MTGQPNAVDDHNEDHPGVTPEEVYEKMTPIDSDADGGWGEELDADRDAQDRLESENAELTALVAELQARNVELEGQKNALVSDMRHLQADFVNHRNRSQRDIASASTNATEKLVTALIPALDDVDAMRDAGDLEGSFLSITDKILRILDAQGLTRDAEAGVVFDPNVHEAVAVLPSEEVPSNHVVKVLRSGYRTPNRVVRATQVIVAL